MARNKIAVYVWIVDTIESHRHITLEELNRLWCNSSLSDGNPIPRRTFFNYRNAIEEMFNINIQCNRSTFEYYIENCDNEADSRMHHWLLDTFSMTGMLSNSKDLSGRIIVEDVPSAREHLPVVIQAMREDKRIVFDYHPYTRSQASKGVVICPYFVKIFKQLWYVVGFNVADSKIKTYSLDRIRSLVVTDDSFDMPATITPYSYFKDCFGIVNTSSEPREVTLRVSRWLANYFRALPLHDSQLEQIHGDYSLFTYKLKVTDDFVQEILRYGANIEVVTPIELRVRVVEELKKSLANYGIAASVKGR